MNQGNGDNQTEWRAWRKACQDLGVSISDEQEAQLHCFYEHLIEANRSVNLTRITALEDFLYRHLLDSLTLAPLLPANARLADIGSGAGIPAIPLAIARPDIQVTAVESVGKKCAFIEEAAQKLQLSGFTVRNQRSETLGQDPQTRAKFDAVSARAVAALPVLLELCLPLVKVGGRFLAMKGLSYEPELDASKNALKLLGGKLNTVQTFEHPSLVGARLLIFEKIKPTPSNYPRSIGLPAKTPL
jgi:16S rRNA (guanine527-N7)-methyltransferase